MLAYEKPMRSASDVDLTPLIRTCNGQRLHQVVEGSVRSGARKKHTRRSNNSGECPMELCKECVKHMHSKIGSF